MPVPVKMTSDGAPESPRSVGVRMIVVTRTSGRVTSGRST